MISGHANHSIIVFLDTRVQTLHPLHTFLSDISGFSHPASHHRAPSAPPCTLHLALLPDDLALRARLGSSTEARHFSSRRQPPVPHVPTEWRASTMHRTSNRYLLVHAREEVIVSRIKAPSVLSPWVPSNPRVFQEHRKRCVRDLLWPAIEPRYR